MANHYTLVTEKWIFPKESRFLPLSGRNEQTSLARSILEHEIDIYAAGYQLNKYYPGYGHR